MNKSIKAEDMIVRKSVSLIFATLILSGSLWAESIKVFAASSTKLAMSEIVEEFKKLDPKNEVLVTFSATGKAYAQFSNGFDYDIFMAADSTYPAKIVEDGNAISQPEIYALGVLALYSSDKELVKEGMDALKNPKVKHISIASPKVAPYGLAATEIIKSYGLDELVASKLVLGDNIAQSVQFVDSGAAEVGIVALSLIISNKKVDEYMKIDESKYKSLEQSFVITKYAKEKPLAMKFAAFIRSSEAKKIFTKYGFSQK